MPPNHIIGLVVIENRSRKLSGIIAVTHVETAIIVVKSAHSAVNLVIMMLLNISL
jgi:hypothetical protein